MKKYIKIFVISICAIGLLILIDVLCALNFNKPLFAIKEDNGDSVNLIYRGLFFDTYICQEYSIAVIKSKGTKFSCSNVSSTISEESDYEIVDLENVKRIGQNAFELFS